jgi:hypothetical protein
MSNNKTELVFILDKSGSMHHLESDTIGSFNGLIDKQKREAGTALITTVLFNTSVKILHDRMDLQEVSLMTNKDYCPSGGTALLDAVGTTLRNVRHSYNDQLKEERPNKVMFIIITDGMENASREFTYKKVKEEIEKAKEKYDWEFLFIGANIDAVKEGSKFGIREDRSVRYHADTKGNEVIYSALEETMTNYRSGKKIEKNWNKKITEDFLKRTK